MKIGDIIDILEKEFPSENAYEWDNVGLLVGDKSRDVSKIVVCLDVTMDVLELAKNEGAELVAAHHPMIFSPMNRVTAETKEGRLLLFAIENKIAVYAAHTNCDKGENGINQQLGEIFELKDLKPLEDDGLGRIGTLAFDTTAGEFAKTVGAKLNTHVRFCGDENRMISRVAICSGAGGDSIETALLKGADVLITGDTKYHQMLDFYDKIGIIDAGHYPTEIIVTDIFKKILCPQNVEVIKAEGRDVFKYM